MPSIACTLFEKHYHHGFVALTNSLYHNNYRGAVYAGYKGSLPAWCAGCKADPAIAWEGASTLAVTDDFKVHLLPVNTEMHFAFYKPFFMLELFKIIQNDIEGIAYFDPDIVIRYTWSAFEKWMTCGVAVVHEITDKPATHPVRTEWKKVIHAINRQPVNYLTAYINSGFCGVMRQNIEFVRIWADVIEAGIKDFQIKPKQWGQTQDKTYLFYNTDQDALNIAAMCCNTPLSEIGPEAMDLISGGFLMSHALGRPKPWYKKYIRFALKGIPPTLADKGYWLYAMSPIQLYSKTHFNIQRIKISIASFIGRFYVRS